MNTFQIDIVCDNYIYVFTNLKVSSFFGNDCKINNKIIIRCPSKTKINVVNLKKLIYNHFNKHAKLHEMNLSDYIEYLWICFCLNLKPSKSKCIFTHNEVISAFDSFHIDMLLKINDKYKKFLELICMSLFINLEKTNIYYLLFVLKKQEFILKNNKKILNNFLHFIVFNGFSETLNDITEINFHKLIINAEYTDQTLHYTIVEFAKKLKYPYFEFFWINIVKRELNINYVDRKTKHIIYYLHNNHNKTLILGTKSLRIECNDKKKECIIL